MQNQEDQNFLDAWENGGSVDGKPVNDARLLAHFKQRRDALSRDDPLWDEWDNRIKQYEFNIADSKMTLKWDQHKVSEKDMAAFYQKWSRTAPFNSNFSREMRSAAAKWLTSANQRTKTASTVDKQKQHDEWVASFYENHVRVGETVNARLLQIAKVYGAMPLSGTSLADLNPDSVGYGRFMDIYVDGRTNDPFVQNVIDDVEREARKIDPNFRFDKRHIDSVLRQADDGLGTLASRSLYKTERDDWTDRRADVRQAQNHIQQAPIIKRIFDAQEMFGQMTANCNGDPSCEMKAVQKLRMVIEQNGRKLMRGGIDDVNTEIVAAIASTDRVLRAVMEGKKPPQDASARDETVFDLGAPSEARGRMTLGLYDIASRDRALREGGWISSKVVTDQTTGQPMLDEHGDPVFQMVVHAKQELPPVDWIEMNGVDMLDDDLPGVRFFGPIKPVAIAPMAPDGRLLAPNEVTRYVTENGQQTLLDPSAAPDVPYVTMEGVIGPDGRARTVYRLGTGTPGDPLIWTPDQPQAIDPATGQPIQLRVTPDGTVVIPMSTTIGMDDEDKPTYLLDYAPIERIGQVLKTPLTDGHLPMGAYLSADGANGSAVVGEYHDTGDKDQANHYAQRYAAEMARMAQTTLDPVDAARYSSDAETIVSYDHIRDTAPAGASYNVVNGVFEAEHQWSPDKQPYVDSLHAAGVDETVFGPDDFARRVALMQNIDAQNARLPSPGLQLGRRLGQGIMTGIVPTDRDRRAEELAAARGQLMNPQQLAATIRVPGAPLVNPAGRAVQGIAAQFGQDVAAAATTMMGAGLGASPIGASEAPTFEQLALQRRMALPQVGVAPPRTPTGGAPGTRRAPAVAPMRPPPSPAPRPERRAPRPAPSPTVRYGTRYNRVQPVYHYDYSSANPWVGTRYGDPRNWGSWSTISKYASYQPPRTTGGAVLR